MIRTCRTPSTAEQWLRDGSLDYIVGQDPYVVAETGVRETWLPDAANANGAAAYYRPPRRVYDERVGLPSIDMYRALNQNLITDGWAGQYHGYLLVAIRRAGVPDPPRAGTPGSARSQSQALYHAAAGRHGGESRPRRRTASAPSISNEGETASVTIRIEDDVESAKADGEMRKPILTIRFSYFCIEDEYEIRFNGEALPLDQAEITDERGLEMQTILRGGMDLQAPLGMSAHWFRFSLPIHLVKRGDNLVEVEMFKFEPRAAFKRSINGVEVLMRYKDMQRPERFDVERVAPLSA